MKRVNFFGMLGLVVAIAIAVTACVEYKQTPTSPTSQTSSSLATDVAKVLTSGNWSSDKTQAATSFSPGTCGNFEWAITSMTATSASGTFKAVCAGGQTLEGSAAGTLNGLTGNVTATGTATTNGVGCPFTLNATAVPQSLDSVKVTYTGTVCGVAVSGTEVLKKK